MSTQSLIIIKLVRVILFLCLVVNVSHAFADPPANFAVAKRFAKQIFRDHKETFYCGCRFDKHGKIDLQSCGYKIQGNHRRATRIEWEHIMPVSLWGQHLPCWKNAICCRKSHCYKGRRCCRKVDKRFAQMEADLHNLVPAIGELNALRSNYRFSVLPFVEPGQLGTCEIKIDPETRRVEPRAEIKGVIARAYLYMSTTYGITLSDSQQQLMNAWNKLYPPDAWEIEWDKRVAFIQGNHKQTILDHQRKL